MQNDPKKTETPPQELIDAADGDEFEVDEDGPIPVEEIDDEEDDSDEAEDDVEDSGEPEEDEYTDEDIAKALKQKERPRGGQQPDGGTLDLSDDE